MKLFQAITAIVLFASGAVGSECIEKDLTEDIKYSDFSDDIRLGTWGRNKLRKGSNGKVVGFSQGYCVVSPGPEDKQGEICVAVLAIKSENIHLQYYYPKYKDP